MSHAHHAKPVHHPHLDHVRELLGALGFAVHRSATPRRVVAAVVAGVALLLVGGAAAWLEYHGESIAGIAVLLAGVPTVTGCVAYWAGDQP